MEGGSGDSTLTVKGEVMGTPGIEAARMKDHRRRLRRMPRASAEALSLVVTIYKKVCNCLKQEWLGMVADSEELAYQLL